MKGFGALLFLALALSFVPTTSHAILGVGNFSNHWNRYQINNSAKRRKFEWAPFVSFHYQYRFLEDFEFTPELGFAFHRKPSPNHSRLTAFVLYPLAWKPFERHVFRAGIGNQITRVAGPGNAVTLNDGNATSIFYQPSRSSFSHVAVAFAGYEYRILEDLGVRGEVFVGPILSKYRSYSYMFGLHLYYF